MNTEETMKRFIAGPSCSQKYGPAPLHVRMRRARNRRVPSSGNSGRRARRQPPGNASAVQREILWLSLLHPDRPADKQNQMAEAAKTLASPACCRKIASGYGAIAQPNANPPAPGGTGRHDTKHLGGFPVFLCSRRLALTALFAPATARLAYRWASWPIRANATCTNTPPGARGLASWGVPSGHRGQRGRARLGAITLTASGGPT